MLNKHGLPIGTNPDPTYPKPPPPPPPPPRKDTVTYVQKVIKGDTYMVLADSAVQLEDEFSGLYFTNTDTTNVIIEPPYEPKVLAKLVTQNNILNQCVEAMEVNIDGTGYEFVPKEDDGSDGDPLERKRLESLFLEPCPGKSFIQIRRKLRRELESTGGAYLEVLRNMAGDILGFRNLDSYTIRMIKLDEPVLVKRWVQRDGKDVEMSLFERERRFVQVVGNARIFFKEFGATRDVHRTTGVWADVIEDKDKAGEVIYFNVNPDINGPYGVPRWINQLPSVLGSRKAEEENLAFFDAGGMPPAIIFIQGGTLSNTVATQLNGYLSGQHKSKNRAVVVEAQSSSGSLESAGTVKVNVERFGDGKDAMYANYDKAAEDHVRVGFRLPPTFVGKAQDYSYATAVVSYMVAEAQVFQPERAEFDAIINNTIVKGLGIKTLVLRSKPTNLKTVEDMIKAVTLVADRVDGPGLVELVNSMAGTQLEYKEPPAPPVKPTAPTPAPAPATPPPAPTEGAKKSEKLPPEDKMLKIFQLARNWAIVTGLRDTDPFNSDILTLAELEDEIRKLASPELTLFYEAVASQSIHTIKHDPHDCLAH